MTRLFIGAGRRAGIRPADLVGAITNEAGIAVQAISARSRLPTRSRSSKCRSRSPTRVVDAMRKATLRGQKVAVRHDRDSKR